MRNRIFDLLIVLAIFAATPAHATVGIKLEGSMAGQATDIDIQSKDTVATIKSGNTFKVNSAAVALVAAGAYDGEATSMTSSETAVPTSYAYVKKAISNTVGQAGTLANGTPGQLLTLETTVVAGSGTFVLTPTTKSGFTDITFNAAGDRVTLLFVSTTTGWVIIGERSLTVTGRY